MIILKLNVAAETFLGLYKNIQALKADFQGPQQGHVMPVTMGI